MNILIFMLIISKVSILPLNLYISFIPKLICKVNWNLETQRKYSLNYDYVLAAFQKACLTQCSLIQKELIQPQAGLYKWLEH